MSKKTFQSNSVYKFYPVTKWSLDNINNSQLYCNHFSAFNDPFECWSIEKHGIPDPIKEKRRFKNVIKTWGFDSSDDVSIEDYYQYLEEFDTEYSFRVNYYIDNARISCFCERSDNLLMWAHYADGLRGFAVEYDKNILLEDHMEDTRILRVKYKKSPSIIDGMVYEVANDQVWYHEMAIQEIQDSIKYGVQFDSEAKRDEIALYQGALKQAYRKIFNLYSKMLATKPLDWKYEHEHRLIIFSNRKERKGVIFQHKKNAVKSIILGDRMSDSDQRQIKSVLDNADYNIPVWTAKRSKNSFLVTLTRDQ